MKATGIVRRMDDLGRVVLPKEIRRTLRIREGDPLEIYTIDGGVCFKKYSSISEFPQIAQDEADALTSGTSLGIIICDRDEIVAVAGTTKKDKINQPITKALEDILETRRIKIFGEDEYIQAFDGLNIKVLITAPIISDGDLIGAVIFVESEWKTKATETDIQLACVASKFLGSQYK
jgi:AbrB family transcriptional regulator (stage V sporulation protein T)